MLGFLKPRGELVEITGRTVVFLSLKPYKMDQRSEVRLGVPEPAGHTVLVALRVLSCRPGPGDFFVVVGIAEGRREPPSLKGFPLRNHARLPQKVTVKSEGLPSYRAVTRDLGRGGFGAELDGELPVGTMLSVHLEFDEPLGWTLDLKARVAWTSWKSQNRYDAGFAFLEDPLYTLPLEQLAAWCEHMAHHEIVPFKPPDNLPPRRSTEPPNQLPQAHQRVTAEPDTGMPFAKEPEPTQLSAAQRAAASYMAADDDPTPLGLPTLVQPTLRPASFKLPASAPKTIPLQRPSAFPQQSSFPLGAPPPDPVVDETEGEGGSRSTVSFGDDRLDGVPASDLGVRVHFQANLRGWAWEGADDAVVVVLEDVHGTDHWLEFPACRGMMARCRQREINLAGMAVSTTSAMIDELSRHSGESALTHYRFYDSHHRVVLEIVAEDCREQIR